MVLKKNPCINFTEFFSLSQMLLKCPWKEAGFWEKWFLSWEWIPDPIVQLEEVYIGEMLILTSVIEGAIIYANWFGIRN